jgi:predicted PurR-regulated permease PerM
MEAQHMGGRDPTGFSSFTYHVLVVVVVLALALFVWRIAQALLLAFVGILLANPLRGLVNLIRRYLPIPVPLVLVLILLALLALLALFVWLAGPQLNDQLSQFIETLPSSVGQVEKWLKHYEWGQYVLSQLAPSKLSQGQGLRLFSHVSGFASATFGILADVLIVIFTAVYFAANPAMYKRGIIALVPRDKSQRMIEVMEATSYTLQHWLLGQGITMVTVGMLTAVGLWIIGVPLAPLLGVIAGLLEFIPFIGPIAAAVPGVLIALTQGWNMALYAVIVYLIVQQSESHIIIPLIQREVVELPPALIILAVIAMGLVFGFLGALVATPLTAVVMVWIKMLYVQDVLGKPVNIKE